MSFDKIRLGLLNFKDGILPAHLSISNFVVMTKNNLYKQLLSSFNSYFCPSEEVSNLKAWSLNSITYTNIQENMVISKRKCYTQN